MEKKTFFYVLIPFLAGLLFGLGSARTESGSSVLIPFLAGLLFGRDTPWGAPLRRVLIPFLAGLLFGRHSCRPFGGH